MNLQSGRRKHHPVWNALSPFVKLIWLETYEFLLKDRTTQFRNSMNNYLDGIFLYERNYLVFFRDLRRIEPEILSLVPIEIVPPLWGNSSHMGGF